MKKTLVLFVALAVVLSSCFIIPVPGSNIAKADGPFEWVSVSNGLSGRDVLALAIDPTNTKVVYAGTDGGVFKSINGGGLWTKMNNGLTDLYLHSLAIDPTNTKVIYAGTSTYVFKSANGGSLWTRMNNGLVNRRVNSLAIDPTDTEVVYAGTTQSGVFKSANGGSLWTPMNNGLKGNVYAVAIDPTNTQVVYAVAGTGVFKSVNGGSLWTPTALTSTSTHTIPRSLVIDRTNTKVFYSGAEDGYVYKSENGGSSWIQSGVTSGTPDILSLVIDPTNSKIVYAAAWSLSSGGVFKSTDGGSSWTSAGLTHAYTRCLALDPTDIRVIYAGLDNSGVFKSTAMSSYILTTAASPAGGGTISRSPNVTPYAPGAVVTLTARPAAGYTFTGWSGALTDTKNPVSVTMTANKAVTASFASEVNVVIIELKIGSSTMLVGGMPVILEAAPIILNSRTLLPIRAVVEAVGGTIAWEALAQKVTIVRDDKTLELWIGRSVAELNGQSISIDSDSKVVPIIMNGRTLLPLRFVAETLALDVQWNATTQGITITFTP